MKLLLCALALSCLLEGICFALFPALMRRCMEEALAGPDSGLRKMGVAALVLAIVLLMLAY